MNGITEYAYDSGVNGITKYAYYFKEERRLFYFELMRVLTDPRRFDRICYDLFFGFFLKISTREVYVDIAIRGNFNGFVR